MNGPGRSGTWLQAIALACALAACDVEAGDPERVSLGDVELFADFVQPYVQVECASLDCHGVAGRPLRLYSELGLRRAPELRPTPVTEAHEPVALTPEELADNQLAFAGLSADAYPPSAQLALRKPLAIAAGGFEHEGGVHWPTTEDPGYLCLRGYLLADVEDPAADCARALAATAP